MKFPAFLRRKSAVAPMSVANSPGLVGYFNGLLQEPFSGAWQRNIVVDSPRDILSFSGTFAPLTLIAADVSKLDVCLLVEENGIKSKAPDTSPFWRPLRKPNHYQNRIQFLEQWILSKLIHGNTYVLKVRDNRRMVVQLYILDPQRVKPLVAENGDVYYDLSADFLSGVDKNVIVPAKDMIHDRWNCLWHPLCGVSPLYAAALSATMGRRIQNNSARFFQNQSRPSGLLVVPGKLLEEDAKMWKKAWDENYGGDRAGGVAVLGNGLQYQSMSIPADQAQLIEQLEWTSKDVAACLHMPLFKVGGPIPPNSSVETMQLVYEADCLQKLIEDAELSLEEGIEILPNYCIELDTDNLSRMDTPSQIKALVDQVGGGIMAPNEARKARNLPPVQGGKTPYLQQQNFSLAALDKRDAQDDPFGTSKPVEPKPADPKPEPAPSESAKAVDAEILKMTPAYSRLKFADIIARRAA